jgi:hypothetical protein
MTKEVERIIEDLDASTPTASVSVLKHFDTAFRSSKRLDYFVLGDLAAGEFLVALKFKVAFFHVLVTLQRKQDKFIWSVDVSFGKPILWSTLEELAGSRVFSISPSGVVKERKH